MKQLIDKSALVAEIENIEADAICQYNSDKSRYAEGCLDVTHRIKHLLDAFEVKEVDLDKECRKYLTEHFNVYEDDILQSKRSGMPLDTFDVMQVAKHFYELGLAQKGE